MKRGRTRFYTILAVTFPFAFLLHWNGLADFTYYWALVLIDGTHSFFPQFIAALISILLLYGSIAGLYEWNIRIMDPKLRAQSNDITFGE